MFYAQVLICPLFAFFFSEKFQLQLSLSLNFVQGVTLYSDLNQGKC